LNIQLPDSFRFVASTFNSQNTSVASIKNIFENLPATNATNDGVSFLVSATTLSLDAHSIGTGHAINFETLDRAIAFGRAFAFAFAAATFATSAEGSSTTARGARRLGIAALYTEITNATPLDGRHPTPTPSPWAVVKHKEH
jgi:hypothetical protein